jgi:hypothetical protein
VTLDLCEIRVVNGGTEPCDPTFGGAEGHVATVIGRGLFDQAFKELLGVSGVTTGGDFSFFADGITGTPASAHRIGGSAAGSATLTVIAPEPATGLMLLAGGLALARRYGRSRTLGS